jgi:lipopolysaccharide/colanic/teichoic acid biosynthesis glycosyltransferase
MYQHYIKRPLDIILSGLALIILSPVFAIVAILVRMKLGSPVLFTQERPGKIDPLTGKEVIFRLYKFRSMTNETDENGELLPKELRLTQFGKRLRSTSLDELPELINILKGDMSIVGPRPLLVKYLPLYNEHQRKRHLVRPGLTGYAQANGRNAISWEEKFDWDVKYVDHISFLGDWKIIIETVMTVIRREGINAAGEATMKEFTGSGEKK